MRKNLAAAAFAMLLIASAPGIAQEASPALVSPALHERVMSLKKAGAPLIQGDYILFTAGFSARFVGLAFEHENFAILHPMMKNPNGVFFLAWAIPPMMAQPLHYRLMADGAWCADPSNPDRETDPLSGLSLSVVRAPLVSDEKPGVFPLLADDGRTVRFRFRGAPGEIVTVTGTFNAWDPFMYELEEVSPGRYALDLPLPEGKHRYAYLYQGEYHHDSLNPASEWTQAGVEVSCIDIAPSAGKKVSLLK